MIWRKIIAEPRGYRARPHVHGDLTVPPCPSCASSRPNPCTSCARSRPSSSAPCCCSPAARTRSCCCAWPRRRSGPAAFPFPVMHVDTGHNFPEVLEFRDRRVARARRAADRRLRAGLDRHRPRGRAGRCSRNRLQTVTLLDAIAEHRFDAAFGGARRDEERARAKERIFSFRDAHGQWDPRAQRPELWNLYNGVVGPGENVARVPDLELDRARRLALHRARRTSSCRRSTTRTSARCSSATGCSTRSPSGCAGDGEVRSPSACATARSAT